MVHTPCTKSIQPGLINISDQNTHDNPPLRPCSTVGGDSTPGKINTPVSAANHNIRLNICHMNARSLLLKIPEVTAMVSEHNIHILAITETWFTDKTVENDIKIPGFQAPFRRDRNSHGGGVCVYVNQNISCTRRHDLEPPCAELLIAEITVPHSCFPPLLLCCCYRPPRTSLDVNFFTELDETLQQIATKNIILIGDFNAHNSSWCPTNITSINGRHLQDLTDLFNLTQLCSSPTHIDNTGQPTTLLDLIFTNTPDHFEAPTTLPPLSDHLPVLISTSEQVMTSPPSSPQPRTELWDLSNVDPQALSDCIAEAHWDSLFANKPDMNDLWADWKDLFLQCIRKHIPTKPVRSQTRPNKPWFNKHLANLIRTKNRLFRRAHATNNQTHWAVYKTIRNRSTTEIAKAKWRYNQKRARALCDPNCTPNNWWRVAKELSGQSQSSSPIPPLQDNSGNLVTGDVDKAEALNATFIHHCSTLAHDPLPAGPTPITSTFSFQPVSPDLVRDTMARLPNKHSTGPDGISYVLIKIANEAITPWLTRLFNYSIELSQVPDEWKSATITPKFKGGRKDRKTAANYRPISLTCCIARLMEKLLNTQVLKYLISKDLLYHLQSGFLPLHSTITQLCFLIHSWQSGLDNNEVVQATFLDLSKAYDRVWTHGLLYKMWYLGFSPPTLRWFTSFLTARTQRVKVGNQYSSWCTPQSGIPQGTVLGPVLFLIFINDLPKDLHNKPSIFADDSTVSAMGPDATITSAALTSDLHHAHAWAHTWGMEFNPEKSEHLTMFNPAQFRNLPPPTNHPVSMDGHIVPQVSHHKHLGLTLNSSLTWTDHIAIVRRKCAQRMGILYRLSSVLPRATIRQIYLATVRPIMEYGCQVWSGGNTNPLQVLQNRFCKRYCTHLPPLENRFSYHTLLLFFKLRSHLAPTYLQSILPSPFSTSVSYNLRKQNYAVPLVHKKNTLSSFLPRALIMWNALPEAIQRLDKISSFKRALRTHLNI